MEPHYVAVCYHILIHLSVSLRDIPGVDYCTVIYSNVYSNLCAESVICARNDAGCGVIYTRHPAFCTLWGFRPPSMISLFCITIVGLLLTFGGLALHAILIEWNFPWLLSVC